VSYRHSQRDKFKAAIASGELPDTSLVRERLASLERKAEAAAYARASRSARKQAEVLEVVGPAKGAGISERFLTGSVHRALQFKHDANETPCPSERFTRRTIKTDVLKQNSTCASS
jgi:hypothetical protein